MSVWVKKYCACKKDCSWNTRTFICQNSWYLKSIVDNSVIERYEVISLTDIVSTNVTNTISTNVWRVLCQ